MSSRDDEAYALRSTQQQLVKGLFITNRWGANDSSQLVENKITHVLVVGYELPKPKQEGISWKKISITDDVRADLLGQLQETYEFIQEALENDDRVLVHCSAGRSRSASVCIAYIMKSKKVCFETAFKLVDGIRMTCLNGGFEMQLKEYENTLAVEK